MRLALGVEPPYLVVVRRSKSDRPRNRQGALHVESNGQSRSQPTQNCLDDLRLSNYDRMLGKRYVEQGEDLADLAIRTSRGLRKLLGNAGKLLRTVITHNRHDFAKTGVVHSD
jgi:hypothetical protein